MIFLAFGFLIGLFLGSLVLCIAERSLTDETFFGRSYCDHCKKTLSWVDLIPILSFTINRGKCRQCGHKLSKNYLLSEIFMGLIIALQFYFIFVQNNLSLEYFASLSIFDRMIFFFEISFQIYIVSVFAILFVTDFKKYLLPNRITYPAMGITIAYLVVDTLLHIYALYTSIKMSLIGEYLLPPHSNYFYMHAFDLLNPLTYGIISAFGAAGFFWLLIFGSRGRGMGGGDLKLAFLMGLVLGFPNIVVAIMLSFILGSLYAIALIVLKRKKFGQTIPFGPFLSIGSLIVLFTGDKIFNWYLGLRFF
jgi:prepilin signal peptidase PulO-like enzyme (type II secretory pathway)